MEQSKTKQFEAIVRGRVQGVSFRYYTRKEAHRLGVTGWVANLADGTVRIVAQGFEPALVELLAFLHRGPTSARVDAVDTQWVEVGGDFPQFGIRWR